MLSLLDSCARSTRALLFVVVALVGAGPALAERQKHSSMEFKAAFAYKFASMTTWPEGSIPRDEFTLCVLGDQKLANTLGMITSGKTLQNRRVKAALLRSARHSDACQMVFIPGDRRDKIASDLRLIGRNPVLTVSDAETFVDQGGMIQLVEGGERLRFDVNRDAATHADLKISARVLRLAKRVIGADGASASPAQGAD